MRNFFFKDGGGVPPSTKAVKPSPSPPMAIPQAAPPTQVDATSSAEFNQYLQKILKDSNLPGPDYYEFSNALETLKSAPLTEQQKFVTMFAGFQAQGITAQSLVDTAKQYIVILNNRKAAEFDASVSSAEHTIEQKQAQYTDLLNKNTELAKQIQDNGTKAEVLLGDINTSKSKLETKKTTFNMAFQALIAKIGVDIENITKYLINGTTTQ